MKFTRENLKAIIKEELKKINVKEFVEPEFTPGQQDVIDKIDELIDAVQLMGESNPDMTDYYIALFRALQKAGVRLEGVVGLV
jgi:hypothetical protein